ncbi:MAG: glycosyltransferase family 4 protein [bacterium]|nr:glycosyltransferase family 4 protein [bacterium]
MEEKRKLKILLVSDMYYPLPGGIPEHIHHLYIEMKMMGHTVHILTGKSIKEVKSENSDIKRYGVSVSVPANKSFAHVTVGFKMFFDIKNLLQKENYDIIHIHGALAPTLPLAILFFSNTTNVITFHASFDRSIGYEALKSPLSKFFQRIDGVIAVSNEAKRSVYKYFPGDYEIIPNGVDTKRFSKENPKLEKYIDGRINILFVGRQDPRKGIKYLYKAMDYLIEEVPDIRLIVVGKGFLKAFYGLSISEKAKKHVVFEDYVDWGLLPSYYSTANVFVSPAIGGESFGIVLIEAMASGTPVLASNIRGYRQVVDHRKNGYLVKPKDPKAIADGILEILHDPVLRKNLVENGIETAKTYDWNKVAKDVLDFYYRTMRIKSERKKKVKRWF